MNAETPTADQKPIQNYENNSDSTLLAGSPENDTGAAARYERGEIDVYTLVTALPEAAVPPSFKTAYQTARQVMDAPQFRAIADDKKRAQQTREFLNQLTLWRMQRGPGYVAAYEQFERTGKAVDAGKRVFESDWFRQLQEQRAREIAALEEKQRAGRATPEENDRWVALMAAHKGDQQVSEGWKSLADDYQKIKARENTGGMTEDELREKEAQLKQRLFDQLDKASPELRERLLAEIAAADPAFRRGCEDRLRAKNQQPVVASNASEVEKIKRQPDEFTQELFEGVEIGTRDVSTAKAEGCEGGIKTAVDMNGAFAAAVSEHSPASDGPGNSGPDLTRTGRNLTSDLA